MKGSAPLLLALGVVISLDSALFARASRGCELAQEGGESPIKLPGRVDEVFWWLPADTEAVFMCQGPFKLEIPKPEIAQPIPAITQPTTPKPDRPKSNAPEGAKLWRLHVPLWTGSIA